MPRSDFALLGIILVATIVAYMFYKFWQGRIDPRKSGKHFLLFMAVNLLSVFVVVVLFGMVIVRFKDFFFK